MANLFLIFDFAMGVGVRLFHQPSDTGFWKGLFVFDQDIAVLIALTNQDLVRI